MVGAGVLGCGGGSGFAAGFQSIPASADKVRGGVR